jgi:6-pyruvoyltetrahydropterin/6-carboxytetrahydropterin synthase
MSLRHQQASRPESAHPHQDVRAGGVLVTRVVHFNSAHRLHNPDFSDEWNTQTYGKCNNPLWHGHNYVLEVSVLGKPDEKTGYVIDLGELRAILDEKIVEPCDHRNLNEEVSFLRGVIPTTENLVVAFWNVLAPHIRGGQLYSIKLYETERNYAEYRGPGGFQVPESI